MKSKYLECGKITNTHGIRGYVTVASYCDTIEVFTSLKTLYILRGGEYVPMRVEKSSPHKNLALTKLAGIDTVEDAALLKNKLVYADRSDIPLAEGDYFIADLIGLPVINADSGKVYGTVTAAESIAGRYIYTVKTDAGDVLFPAVPEFIDRCDVNSGLYIRPIEGFFDEI